MEIAENQEIWPILDVLEFSILVINSIILNKSSSYFHTTLLGIVCSEGLLKKNWKLKD